MIPTPSASDPTEALADWMELDALRSRDKSSSIASLVKLIRRTGSTDAIDAANGDFGSELSQQIAQDAFAEIENRSKACGDSRYPFDVSRSSIKVRSQPEKLPYTLMLLLSFSSPTSGHEGTSGLFERICAEATLGYLGGDAKGVTSVRFGAPRKAPQAKLSQAIDHLCAAIGEGSGCSKPEKARHTGDDGLDIVAWRAFPDAKVGKLIAFGQCAAGGSGWESKLAELDARAFIKKWLRTPFTVDPIRMFFVPRRIPAGDWENAGIDGGILFDRCRIAACFQPREDVDKQSAKAAKAMITELKRNA